MQITRLPPVPGSWDLVRTVAILILAPIAKEYADTELAISGEAPSR